MQFTKTNSRLSNVDLLMLFWPECSDFVYIRLIYLSEIIWYIYTFEAEYNWNGCKRFIQCNRSKLGFEWNWFIDCLTIFGMCTDIADQSILWLSAVDLLNVILFNLSLAEMDATWEDLYSWFKLIWNRVYLFYWIPFVWWNLDLLYIKEEM